MRAVTAARRALLAVPLGPTRYPCWPESRHSQTQRIASWRSRNSTDNSSMILFMVAMVSVICILTIGTLSVYEWPW
jgi:hypothetical protein